MPAFYACEAATWRTKTVRLPDRVKIRGEAWRLNAFRTMNDNHSRHE
jgi:hypothetical protein